MRIISQLGQEIDRGLAADFPAVEILPFTKGPPPAGTRADVFVGGFANWDEIVAWVDATGVSWVQLTSTGVDKVPAALFPGRTVTCARGASAVPISEWVLGAVLAAAKQFPETWLSKPPRYWNFPFPRIDVVQGSTLGLVGLGGIGAAVAARALPFGMRVRALRRTDAPSPVPGVELVSSLGELLADVDHLVLAAPATGRTNGLIDAAALARVKPGVHLVNIARGALVDQEALRAALDDGRVALATLDTVDPEPLPAGHWMYSHPRVRLSAHVSWYSPDVLGESIAMFRENLARRLREEPLLGVVDPEEGY